MAWPQSCIFKSLASNRFICSVVCLYWKLKSGPCGAEGASVNFPRALWDAPSFSCSVSGLHFFLLPAPAAAKPHIAQGFLSSMPNFLPRQYEWLWIPSSPAARLASWKCLFSLLLLKVWGKKKTSQDPVLPLFLAKGWTNCYRACRALRHSDRCCGFLIWRIGMTDENCTSRWYVFNSVNSDRYGGAMLKHGSGSLQGRGDSGTPLLDGGYHSLISKG